MARVSAKKKLPDSLIIALVTVVIFVVIDFFGGNALLALARHEGKKEPFRIQNTLYHHALQASYEGPAYWGPFEYLVCTNASGMKSDCKDKHSAEKNFDIAFIGDSFTEGVGVNYEDSFVGMVAKAHPELKIANLGVVSYAPTIYLKKLEDYLNRGYTFKKVIVFVDIGDIMDEAFYFENAAGNVQMTSEIIHPGVVAFLKRNVKKTLPLTYEAIYYAKMGWLSVSQGGDQSQAVSAQGQAAPATAPVAPTATTNNLADTATTSQSNPAVVNSTSSTSTSADIGKLSVPEEAAPHKNTTPATQTKSNKKNVWIYDREYTRSAWTYNLESPGYGDLGVHKSIEKTIQQMERVAALLKSHNIKLSVGVYPWPAQLMYDQENSLQVQLWKKFCDQHCENFYDAFPAFFNAVRTTGMDATIYQYYFQGDMHFAKEGNALVADTILRNLKNTP
jgi:lysophospholipase L1-like esterase